MPDNRLIKIFNPLTIGDEYTRGELIEMLLKEGLGGNIAGLSYNRWNRGMTVNNSETLMFEWIRHGTYKYLGINYKYNGKTFLFDGNTMVGLVGIWKNGEFKFSAYGVHSFRQWIDKGHTTVSE